MKARTGIIIVVMCSVAAAAVLLAQVVFLAVGMAHGVVVVPWGALAAIAVELIGVIVGLPIIVLGGP